VTLTSGTYLEFHLTFELY